MLDYYKNLEAKANAVYEIAGKARAIGIDPETEVEIPLAEDLSARVEGLIGPKGVAKDIRECLKTMSRDQTLLAICDKICEGKYGQHDKASQAEQCVRTGLALYTEAVVAAPIEGVADVKIEKNPDGSEYLSIYFSGPIRSAGGTGQAITCLIGDYARQKIGLSEYRPTETEVERYVEEINIYHNVEHLQYKPSDDEVRTVIRNCPVCINGDPTLEQEVDVHKDIPRVPTNRVRGGACLVVAEGIAQKAQKILRISNEMKLKWGWLQSFIKVGKEEEGARKIEPLDKFLRDIVAGRPIFSYPSRPGGFRLRYGRSRNNGLMAKGMHPAAMAALDGFPAIGTQLKVERPGKGMTVVPVDTIEGPVIRLRDGSVVRVESEEQANQLRPATEEVLFNGDILVSFNDFLQTNHPIVPSAWCEEWWALEVKDAGGLCEDPYRVSFEEAVKYSEKYGVPLHPRYVYNYSDVTVTELRELVQWLATDMKTGPQKRALEKLLVPHTVREDTIVIEGDDWEALKKTLAVPDSAKAVEQIDAGDPMTLVNELSPYVIKVKAPVYLGTRMGRPEKAKERLMKPAPNILFPVGNYGGNTRSIMKAYDRKTISVEIARMKCPKCGKVMFSYKCMDCGERTKPLLVCPKCGRETEDECPICGVRPTAYDKSVVNIKDMMDHAMENVGKPDPKIKGVKGMMSGGKMFEPLEKGIIRSRNGVYIFKDGTVRFDSTNLPTTHFTPKEIGTSVERLKELGYAHDHEGKDLVSQNQIVELLPQDVILAETGVDYLVRVTKALDEMLTQLYGLEQFYNARTKEDLVGHLIIGLAPHTSAGVLGRIIGFSKARACYAHPYFHASTRRDCDGDENGCMFLLDALLNFSKKYLPSSRGGKMDACLVLTLAIDPMQIDDQVHKLETTREYPLDFYRRSHELLNPRDFKIETVESRLGTDRQYDGFGFTHGTTAIDNGVTRSTYTTLGEMEEKVNAQLKLGKKLRSVDEKDEAERLLNSHFLRDIYGNLRAFGEQKFRCVDCNAKYRRVPLIGKCHKCGGKIILTIAEGSVRKYLEVSKRIADEYGLSDYMKQRLKIVEGDINSVFVNDKAKQFSLAEFM
ncbi:MAG: DNA polymerase II large subunit [Candidatus Diapherotrites archaeon]|nr:DNA polymerase II large subunit [Candidatus Diapherotrites archaeon]